MGPVGDFLDNRKGGSSSNHVILEGLSWATFDLMDLDRSQMLIYTQKECLLRGSGYWM